MKSIYVLTTLFIVNCKQSNFTQHYLDNVRKDNCELPAIKYSHAFDYQSGKIILDSIKYYYTVSDTFLVTHSLEHEMMMDSVNSGYFIEISRQKFNLFIRGIYVFMRFDEVRNDVYHIVEYNYLDCHIREMVLDGDGLVQSRFICDFSDGIPCEEISYFTYKPIEFVEYKPVRLMKQEEMSTDLCRMDYQVCRIASGYIVDGIRKY